MSNRFGYFHYESIAHMVFDHSVVSGPSSSQSCIDWFLRAMLRMCLPPFTFHVPMHTRTFSGVVKSFQRSQTCCLKGIGAVCTRMHEGERERKRVNGGRAQHLGKGGVRSLLSPSASEASSNILAFCPSSPL